MSNRTFPCNKNHVPKYRILYQVANEVKEYLVCSSCSSLDCFRKHIVSRELITNKVGDL